MNNNEIKVLAPQYMKNFMCLGNECEDTCCKFWRIDIDYETYKRYIKISDPKLRYMVREYVAKYKNSTNKNRYASFKLKKDGYCAFLDEDGLCMFQKKCGASYLSDVCATYPRRHVQLDDTLERSGTVSCPEIARIMLFNESPMEFDEFAEEINGRVFRESIVKTTGDSIEKRPLLKWFWPVREFCIDLLQNRSYTIRERLILLGLFTDKLDSLNEDENYEEMKKHIDKYSRIINSGDVKSMLAGIPGDGYIQFKMMMEMVVLRLKYAAISPSFIKLLEEFKQGIGYFEGNTIEQLFANYKKIKADYLKKFDEQYPQVFENYFVNYVFSSIFPIKPSSGAMENYIRLVVHYAFIKLFLAGIGAFHKKFDDAVVQRVFSGISNTVEHNPNYVKLMADAVKSLKGSMLAFTTVLVQE